MDGGVGGEWEPLRMDRMIHDIFDRLAGLPYHQTNPTTDTATNPVTSPSQHIDDPGTGSEFNVVAPLTGNWEAELSDLWDPMDDPHLSPVLPLTPSPSLSTERLRSVSSTIWPVGSMEDLGAPLRRLNLPSYPTHRRLSQDSICLKPKIPLPTRRIQHPSSPKRSSSIYAVSSLNDVDRDDPNTWPEGSKESLFSPSFSASSPTTLDLLKTGYAIGSLEDIEVGGVWTSAQLFPGSTGLMEMGLKMVIPGQGNGRIHVDLRTPEPSPARPRLFSPGSIRPSSILTRIFTD